MKKILSALALLGILSLGGAFAQGMGQFGCNKQNFDNSFCGGNFMVGKKGFMRNLNLTNEQIGQMRVIQDAMATEMQNVFSKLNQNQNYFTGNSFDKDAFLKDGQDRHDAMIKIRADYFEKVFNILTTEQKKEFSQNFRCGSMFK